MAINEERVRPRLVDVATLAGVSLSSASRAISHPAGVRPATLAKVTAAAEKLGYEPDLAARALASGRTRTVGLLVPTLANPIYALFTQSAQRAALAKGLQLVVMSDEYERAQGLPHVRSLIQRGVDGLILIGADHHPAVFELLENTRIPHVFAWSYDEARGRGCVGVSNRTAVWAVVRHLLDLGHRRFAVLSGDPRHNERARSRLDGVRDALRIAGHPLLNEAVVICPFTIGAGRVAMNRVLSLGSRPTAVICGTDLLAAGALAAANALGVHVPDELSVTGFDDVDFASLLTPPLTTVRVPAEAMGRRVLDSLVEAIDAEGVPADVELAADLILRGSTGPAPRRGVPAGPPAQQ